MYPPSIHHATLDRQDVFEFGIAFFLPWRHVWPVETIRRVMQITARGYRVWRQRPMSVRQRGG